MCRTLLVDDFLPFRELLAMVLDLYTDFTVVGQAGDGLQAIVLVSELQPELVLMDLNMPRCDGVEATRVIKACAPDTIIILLTDSVDKRRIQRALEYGAVGCLTKGTTIKQLTASVQALIRRHQQATLLV